MSTLDLAEAINSVWDAQSLDSNFTTYWDSGETSLSIVLFDSLARPGQPMPYCVFNIGPPLTINRSSDGSETISEIRHTPLSFSVHMRRKSGVSKSPKQVAGELIDEIKKVFGGHPTVKAQALSLDNGRHLITTYVNDFGMASGEDEYVWRINYQVKTDIPVQALTA